MPEDDRPVYDPEQAEARRRLAAATRVVIERLVATSAPTEMLVSAAERMEAWAETLAGYPHGRTYRGYAEPANAPGPMPNEFFDHSPLSGMANPIAPPLRSEIVDGVVHGTVRFGGAYEGPPGSVHGGFVAALHDDILGQANGTNGKPSMTGTLTVVYRRPTPLYVDLRYEARLDRVDGRKQFCTSQLWAGDVLCNEAEGIFVTITMDRFAELLVAREERTAD
jgi:acyl-coenzyme A thioesterase PaaI-like protein